VIQLPGKEAIVTPTYTKGKLLVAGGFGSHEVYALDAKTGETRWVNKTRDNGPTSVAVEGDYGAFSTESCDLCVINTETGKTVWEQLLAGSLLTQPAVSEGKLYVAFPGGHAGEPQPAPPPLAKGEVVSRAGMDPNGRSLSGAYRLLCEDLKTGQRIWEQDIPGEVITAPVVADGNVYLTCMDGTTFCMDQRKGCMAWTKQVPATSAPTVGGGFVMTTQKRVVNGRVEEGLVRLDVGAGEAADAAPQGMRPSKHFEREREDVVGPVNPNDRAARRLDASARANLNIVSAVDSWTYQGPRAAYGWGSFINAQDNLVNSMEASTGKMKWQALVTGPALDSPEQRFLAPVLGKKNVYLLSNQGYVMSMKPDAGAVNFSYRVLSANGVPFCMQPCLAEGNIYAGTKDGRVICIPVGKDADGWYGWGGGGGHSGSR
jgi:outer membrane protein assembly factor BamB